MGPDAASVIVDSALGTRLVVRYRIEGGATDALGYLREKTALSCTIETRHGDREVLLSDVVAAKPVPEPPAQRRARFPTT
jgi:hypothetical protein